MITDTQKKQIEQGSLSSVQKERIRERIDQELDNLLWLCQNYPNVFLEETFAYAHAEEQENRYRRMKTLILCLKHLTKADVQLVKDALKSVQNEET